jgi:hypothetical protein
VANRYAVEWLDLSLKRLLFRMLQGLVGSAIGVRFQTDGQDISPYVNERAFNNPGEERMAKEQALHWRMLSLT